MTLDHTIFAWTLVNLSCCAIIATSIIVQIYTNPIINDHIYQEFFERTMQATFLFAITELISSIVMVINTTWAWGPFIIHCFALFASLFAMHASFHIIEGSDGDHEKRLRISNVMHGILWVIRFFYLFTILLVLF